MLPYSEFSGASRNYPKQSWAEKLVRSNSEDYAFVAHALGDALTIQVLEQGDSVFTAYAG